MDFDLYNSELYLAHNAPIRLMSARGVRVICTAGRVWLTVEGEAGEAVAAAVARSRARNLAAASWLATPRAPPGKPAASLFAAGRSLRSVRTASHEQAGILNAGGSAFIIATCS